MSPWDLIVWGGAAGVALFLFGFSAAIVTILINIARGKM